MILDNSKQCFLHLSTEFLYPTVQVSLSLGFYNMSWLYVFAVVLNDHKLDYLM